MEYFYYKTDLCALKYKQTSHSFIDDKYMKEHLGLWSYFIIRRMRIYFERVEQDCFFSRGRHSCGIRELGLLHLYGSHFQNL